MARQRVSDQLMAQDRQTVAGCVLILQALAARYPKDMTLAFAVKAAANVSAALEDEGRVRSEETGS